MKKIKFYTLFRSAILLITVNCFFTVYAAGADKLTAGTAKINITPPKPGGSV